MALDREVFVDCADHDSVGIGNNAVRADVRDRSGVHRCRDARGWPSFDATFDSVVMQINLAATRCVGDPFGHDLHDGIKLLASQIAIRVRSAKHLEQFIGRTIFRGGDLGDDLLSQHIQRRDRNLNHIQPPGANRSHQSHRFD